MVDDTLKDVTDQQRNATSLETAGDLHRAIRQAFPWLQLIKALGMSFELNKIALAIAGVFVFQVVCAALDALLLDVETTRASAIAAIGTHWGGAFSWISPTWWSGPLEHLSEPARVVLTPLMAFVSVNPFDRLGFHAGLTGLAAVLIWGLFGGALARISLVQLGWSRGLGARAAFNYAAKHARPLIATPLLPIVVLLLMALFCATFGLLFKLPWIGNLLGGLFLIVPLGLGLIIFILVTGVAAGWPLMIVSVAAEGEDELDALSRSFSYLNHRLSRYALYLAIVFLIGIPGSWLVSLIADGTLQMTRWGLGFTVPEASVSAIFEPNTPILDLTTPGEASTALPETSWTWFLPAFWIGFVHLTARAWAYSYFWSALSIIYLILRKDVDGAEWLQLKPDSIADLLDVETTSEPDSTVDAATTQRQPIQRSEIPLSDDPESQS